MVTKTLALTLTRKGAETPGVPFVIWCLFSIAEMADQSEIGW